MSSMKPNSVHDGVKTHGSRSSSCRSELIALKQSVKIKLKYTQQEAALRNKRQNQKRIFKFFLSKKLLKPTLQK
ncbi:hypothetical protein DPMN_049164 [Dreissena polymorpha]|uniref:Uncharacterized protein n=1 Tax=Dreissena polymorpha TaxID=45954 RepID=A0A9D4I4L1_DREPO|nr:hypothetical protein DPMN_049164 [Dreissena polymorpha]